MTKTAKESKKGNRKGEIGASQGKLSGSHGNLHLKNKQRTSKKRHGGEDGGEDNPRGSGETYKEGTECDSIGELPPKILAAEDIPEGGRINTYSKIDYLREITKILRDTPQFDWLMQSPFGKLFSLRTRYCEFSGILVHQMLCRSLVTLKKYEMWFVFGGNPIRYSLKEFAMMTGLNCNPMPPKDVRKGMYTNEEDEKPFWDTLIGPVDQLPVADLVKRLKDDMVETELDSKLSNEKKLQMCLVVIVDGILCNNSSALGVSKKTVEMVKDIDVFCKYPWGRKSFKRSMQMVKIGKKIKDPESLARKLYQSHMSNHGMSLALHLLPLYTVPKLAAIVLTSKTDTYFYDPKFQGLTKYHPFHNQNVCDVEKDPELQVDSLLAEGHSTEACDLTWDDDEDDERVNNIMRGLEAKHKFKPSDWKVQAMRRGLRLRRGNSAKVKSEFGIGGIEGGAVAGDELLNAIEAINDYHDERKWEAIQKIDEDHRDEIRNLFIHAFGEKVDGEAEEMDEDIPVDPRPQKPIKRKVRGASDAESLSSGNNTDTRDDVPEPVKKSKKKKAKKRKTKKPIAEDVVDVDDEDLPTKDDGDNVTKGHDAEGDKLAGDTDRVGEVSHADQEVNQCKDGDGDVIDLANTLFQETAPNYTEPTALGQDNQNAGKSGEEDNVEISPLRNEAIAAIGREAEHVAAEIGETTPVQEAEHVAADIGETTPVQEAEHVSADIGETTPVEDAEHVAAKFGETEPVQDADHVAAEIGETTPSRISRTDTEMDIDRVQDVSADNNDGNVDRERAVDSNKVSVDTELFGKQNVPLTPQAEPKEGEYGSDGGETSDGEDHTADDAAGEPANEAVKGNKAKLGRSLRPRNAPKKFGQTPEEKDVSDDEPAEYHPLSVVSSRKRKALLKILDSRQKKALSVLGQSVTKAFYREIYKQKCNVLTTHMEAMLAMIWARRGAEMLRNRVAIMDGGFVNYLIREHGRYSKARNPPVPFAWSRPIQNYVLGNVKNRSGSLQWLLQVDNLYAVMSWGGNHWVALSINLFMGTVSIMDSNQSLYAEPRIQRFMKPVIEILPLVMRDLVDNAYDKPEAFEYYRDEGIPQYARSGDSGPIAAKFIELNAEGHDMKDFTEEDVDNFRMKYAVDVYEENEEPL